MIGTALAKISTIAKLARHVHMCTRILDCVNIARPKLYQQT